MLTAASVADPSASARQQNIQSRLELFEEYANGGLEILKKELSIAMRLPMRSSGAWFCP